MKRLTRTTAALAISAASAFAVIGTAAQAGAVTVKPATTTVSSTTVAAKGHTTASSNLTISLPSFAYSICGDNAFEDGSEPDSAHVVIQYQDGYGPFGGGSYDCATGELTL